MQTLGGTLDRLVSQALARDVAPGVAEEARRRDGASPEENGHSPVGRCASSAAPRRTSRRSSGGMPSAGDSRPAGAARFVVAAVVEDLRASGRDGEAIWDQLQRGWSDSVPDDVLEEYRLRLCG